MIQGRLAGQRDVGQRLLQRENVAANLLDAVLVDAPDVLDAADDDAGHQVTDSFEDVLCVEHEPKLSVRSILLKRSKLGAVQRSPQRHVESHRIAVFR